MNLYLSTLFVLLSSGLALARQQIPFGFFKQPIATCTSGFQTFSYTGSSTNFTVPSGCTTVSLKVWGAGGADGKDGSTVNGTGGQGGTVLLTSSSLSGLALTIFVGGTGTTASVGIGGANGGGNSGSTMSGRSTGGGGGATTVYNSSTLIVAAAGGGGGAPYNGGGQSVGATAVTVQSSWTLAGGTGAAGFGDGSDGCNAGGGGGGGGGAGGGRDCNNGSAGSSISPKYSSAGSNFTSLGATSSALNTSDTDYNGTAGKKNQTGFVYLSWAP